jgi:hypothetical protein
MGARRYDPALGRWISADTLVPEPGSSQSYNRYAYVRNSPLRYTDPSGHADWAGEEESGDTESRLPKKGSWEFLVAYIRYQAYEAQVTLSNLGEQLGQYEDADSSPPIAVWTWDDGQGFLPAPNPHFQLRDDLDALNDILLLGADVTADGLTIFGHGLLLASGASVFALPPGDELLEVTGAFLFLNTAFGLDVLALADTAASRGINSEEFFVQAGFVGADAASGRVAGTYVVQLVVAATDVTVDVFGDSAGLSEKYGSGLTFYEWYQLYGDE